MLKALGPEGYLVNVARASIVDTEALTSALRDRVIAGAAIDVYDNEPDIPGALKELDNVVLTPHIASSTEETVQAMGECVLENIRSWFAGKGAITPVA